MDLSEFSTSNSPKRELQLQGPRPTPLKVRKESHKIRKPPVVPQQQHHSQPRPPPVIIYTVSPKVIHAHPNEFMTLVQRLTGSSSTNNPSISTSSWYYFQDNISSGAISPAARLASIEKTKCSASVGRKLQASTDQVGIVEGIEIKAETESANYSFPSVLSPNPSSLRPIHPNFFSSSPDQIPMSFFHDLSPLFHNTRNHLEGNNSFPSPSNFLLSPYMVSPTPAIDLFNNFFEF